MLPLAHHTQALLTVPWWAVENGKDPESPDVFCGAIAHPEATRILPAHRNVLLKREGQDTANCERKGKVRLGRRRDVVIGTRCCRNKKDFDSVMSVSLFNLPTASNVRQDPTPSLWPWFFETFFQKTLDRKRPVYLNRELNWKWKGKWRLSIGNIARSIEWSLEKCSEVFRAMTKNVSKPDKSSQKQSSLPHYRLSTDWGASWIRLLGATWNCRR